MPPPPILDPATLDFTRLVADRDELLRVNPHRHEFVLLDGVLLCDAQRGVLAGYHDIRPDAWWTRGHVPGRPLFPGVLMIEAAAQLSSFLYHRVFGSGRFFGMVGVDEAKFRGVVEPPCRFVIVGRVLDTRRRLRCATQGFIRDTMVFEAIVSGMVV